MPRPSETRGPDKIFADVAEILNTYLHNRADDVPNLTVKISQLKQARADLGRLQKQLEKLRDVRIFEESNKKVSIRRKAE